MRSIVEQTSRNVVNFKEVLPVYRLSYVSAIRGLIAGNNAPEAISVLLSYKFQCSQTIRMALLQGTGQLSRYSDLLRAGRFWDRFPVEARFSADVQTGIGYQLASYTMSVSHCGE